MVASGSMLYAISGIRPLQLERQYLDTNQYRCSDQHGGLRFDIVCELYGASGLYRWNGSAWSKINTVAPAGMAASGRCLYASFASGLYSWNGSAWTRINTGPPTSMVASGSVLYADYGARCL